MNDTTVATIQADWSENPKVHQSREEKSAYYNDEQLSLHAMYEWRNQTKRSMTSLTVLTTKQLLS